MRVTNNPVFGAKTVVSPNIVQRPAGFSSPIELDGDQSDFAELNPANKSSPRGRE